MWCSRPGCDLQQAGGLHHLVSGRRPAQRPTKLVAAGPSDGPLLSSGRSLQAHGSREKGSWNLFRSEPDAPKATNAERGSWNLFQRHLFQHAPSDTIGDPMRFKLLAALAVFVLSAVSAQAHTHDETYHGYDARWRAQRRPWHGNYYHIGWGGPVALVVPPTAEMTSDYSWGVASTRVTRIDHQFQRPYPGYYPGG